MKDGTPYWVAFLKHPVNKAGALLMVAGSIGLSLPWGVDGLGLGLLGLLAIQIVGLATVPGLSAFRSHVDKVNRRQARDAWREHLLREIGALGGSPHLRSYEQMVSRVISLYRLADDKSTALNLREVEQLDDLTVDYLRMCLSDAAQRGGKAVQLAPAAVQKLRDIDRRLESGGLDSEEEQQLRKARLEYEEAVSRHARLSARRSALEASLVAMPLRLEEVYQMVMTSPRAGNLSQMLEESVSKLRLAEEAALDIERSLGEAGLETARAPGTGTPPPQRQAVGQRR